MPVRSHSTCNCHVARDHTQVCDTTWESVAEGSPKGNVTFYFKYQVINLKGNIAWNFVYTSTKYKHKNTTKTCFLHCGKVHLYTKGRQSSFEKQSHLFKQFEFRVRKRKWKSIRGNVSEFCYQSWCDVFLKCWTLTTCIPGIGCHSKSWKKDQWRAVDSMKHCEKRRPLK